MKTGNRNILDLSPDLMKSGLGNKEINVETYCNTSLQNIKAFTFVELIVSVGIILLVSTVGYISYTGNIDNKDNAKVTSDLATLDNSFKSYLAETKTLPEANGNKSFYKADGSYAHDETDSAYGVSSFISEKTLSTKYLNSIPLDPRTGYYYAYAKTIDNKFYEIAGVEKKDNNYKSIVKGDYPVKGTELRNLVKEYNGPEFVGNNSSVHFPYNPEEKILTASIYDYSGSVTVTRGSQNFTGNSILDISLVSGDKIVATANSTASIYFSDGSKSSLGDSSKSSELVLANMEYAEDNNLFTKVQLVLNIGTLWTSASKMSENSDFEVYSNDTVAAVRGTVFGVTVNPAAGTNVVVARGDVEVSKLTDTSMIGESLIEAIASNEDISYSPIISPTSVVTNSGHIIVESTESPKGLQIISTGTPTSSTGSINFIPGTIGDREEILIGGTEGNEENIYLDIGSLSNSGISYENFKATIKIQDKLLEKFDYFKLNSTHKAYFTTLGISSSSTGYTFTGGTSFTNISSNQVSGTNSTDYKPDLKTILTSSSGKFDLVACVITKKGEKCSKSRKFTVAEKASFGEPEIAVNTPVGACRNSFRDTDGNCVDNDLADTWKVVAYADYNSNSKLIDTNLTDLYKQGSLPSTDVCAYNNYSDQNKSNTRSNLCLNSLSLNLLYSNKIFTSNYNNLVTKGVYLDNIYKDYFLQYNISDLNLTSGSGFAIEMSVRGGALKRDKTYVLFDIPGVSPGNGFRLQNYSNTLTGGLFLGKHNTATNFQSIGKYGTKSLTTEITEDNKFYKVIAIYINNQAKIEIYDGLNKILDSIYITDVSTAPIGTLKDLYVGTYNYNGTYQYQWNDIIDYVKIYRR